MFKIIILTSLLSLPVTMACFSDFEEAKQLENTCGKFCFKVVKPMIEHMTALQKKVNSHDENGNAEQSNFIKDIEQKLGIAEGKISVLERKLAESEKKCLKQQKIFEDEQKIKLSEQNLVVANEMFFEQSNINKNLSEKIALLESENKLLKEQQQLIQNDEQSSFRKIIEDKIAVLESEKKKQEQQIVELEQKLEKSEKKCFEQQQIFYNQQFYFKNNITDKLEQKFKLFEQKLIDAEEKILEQSSLNKSLSEKIAVLERRFGESEQKLMDQTKKYERQLNYTIKLNNFQSHEIGSQHYYTSGEKLNWTEAARCCGTIGGHLASPQNYQEFDAIRSILDSDNYWIDINDISKEGVFVSLTSQNATYLNWHEGEPNNFDVNENCVIMNERYSTYKMNDVKCDNSFKFVCQLFSE